MLGIESMLAVDAANILGCERRLETKVSYWENEDVLSRARCMMLGVAAVEAYGKEAEWRSRLEKTRIVGLRYGELTMSL